MRNPNNQSCCFKIHRRVRVRVLLLSLFQSLSAGIQNNDFDYSEPKYPGVVAEFQACRRKHSLTCIFRILSVGISNCTSLAIQQMKNEFFPFSFLSSMVKAYIDRTGDEGFISEAIQRLDIEFEFFENNRMHEVNGHRLAAYGSEELNGPRPESYREDYLEAHKHFETESERQQFYTEMIAGAESGWDFSSRWFIKNGTNGGQLFNTHAKSIIPVELNAMLYLNAKTIAEFHTKLGNTNIAAKYANRAQQIFEVSF